MPDFASCAMAGTSPSAFHAMRAGASRAGMISAFFMKGSVIEATNISKRFGGAIAVDGVSLRINRGQILTLIGPNGSGKTTLLKLLLGLEMPDSGRIQRAPGLRVGYMPQKLAIDAGLPITVEYFLSAHSHKHKPASAEVAELCAEVGVSHLLKARIQSLSGGELQRVMLARALLCHPELLVLDEPVQGVDAPGQAQLYAMITRLVRARGLSLLMVSHDLHVVMRATDEVVCLNHHVCCAGHPHSVREDPAFVALFGPQGAEALAVYTHHHNHTH